MDKSSHINRKSSCIQGLRKSTCHSSDRPKLLRCRRTNGASFKSQSEHWTIRRRNLGYDHSSPARALPALATIRSVTFHLEGPAERRGATRDCPDAQRVPKAPKRVDRRCRWGEGGDIVANQESASRAARTSDDPPQTGASSEPSRAILRQPGRGSWLAQPG